MSGESRPKAAPADAQDVKDDSTATEGRKRVDVTRYPPVTVAALQRLPGSSARTFAMAFAIGQWLDMDGSTARLSSGKTAGGSLVDEKRLPDVLEQVGITARTWREYVTEWEANYIGHRCRRGKAFLFSRPLLSSCPACGTRIYVDHPEKSAHLPRGPGFANGVIDATPTASSAPLRGTNSAVQDKPNGTVNRDLSDFFPFTAEETYRRASREKPPRSPRGRTSRRKSALIWPGVCEFSELPGDRSSTLDVGKWTPTPSRARGGRRGDDPLWGAGPYRDMSARRSPGPTDRGGARRDDRLRRRHAPRACRDADHRGADWGGVMRCP
jgi:hypothetical protein